MGFCKEMGYTKKSSITWVFNKIASYEEECRLDIAQMDQGHCVAAVHAMGIAESATVKSAISMLRQYSKWCKKNKVFVNVSDGIFEVSPEDIRLIEPLEQSLFKDDIDLVESIKKVLPIDAGYIEYPVFCLNWIGLNNVEIIALRDNDVDLDDRIIYGQDGSILTSGFSDTVCDTLKRYCACKYSVRTKGSGTVQAVKDTSVGSFLKRMVLVGIEEFGKEYSLAAVNNQCSRMAKKYQALGYPRRHTYQNVWRSGRYHELYRIEQSGVAVCDHTNQSLVEDVFRQKKGYYNAIKMYKVYKEAFNL